MKHDIRHHKNYLLQGGLRPRHLDETALTTPDDIAPGTDRNLLDELQALVKKLGAAKVSLTFYLIEFGGLPQRLARPLLAEAAGSCAMLRLPSADHHLVIYLGPEPSMDTGGFLGRLRRGLSALAPVAQPDYAPDCASDCIWAEVRTLSRCNHDITAPTHLLLDLNAAAPRVLGLSDW